MKVVGLILLLVLAGCASNAPYAILDGSRDTSLHGAYAYDVVILGIDGKRKGSAPSYYRLKPGVHRFQLASSKYAGERSNDAQNHYVPRTSGGVPFKNSISYGKGDGRIWYREYTLLIKPCTRYLMTAVHDHDIGNDKWDLSVVEEEIENCKNEMAEVSVSN